MSLQDYSIDQLYKEYNYLNDSRFNIQSVFKNEDSNVLCVILNIKMKDLKELVFDFGWRCIFDEGVNESQELSICITKQREPEFA